MSSSPSRWRRPSRGGPRTPGGGCSPTAPCYGIPCFPSSSRGRRRSTALHRRFCLWSHASRGTCDQPGLVLGLEPGGSCRGVVYRLPEAEVRAELTLLWRREMVTGSYHPRWVRVRAGAKTLIALAFVVDRRAPAVRGPAEHATSRRAFSRARPARSAHRRTISSTPASRSLRTASSIPTSRCSPHASRHGRAERRARASTSRRVARRRR